MGLARPSDELSNQGKEIAESLSPAGVTFAPPVDVDPGSRTAAVACVPLVFRLYFACIPLIHRLSSKGNRSGATASAPDWGDFLAVLVIPVFGLERVFPWIPCPCARASASGHFWSLGLRGLRLQARAYASRPLAPRRLCARFLRFI